MNITLSSIYKDNFLVMNKCSVKLNLFEYLPLFQAYLNNIHNSIALESHSILLESPNIAMEFYNIQSH